ncbi:hypothetical protein HYALB_00008460 [Hymenoscyphus albidus]|uniref:Cytochrome oxidase subunit II transmembrane region profile domain-containing protein n=2 Tax=Hymenoscyphus TaxID=5182 RepID=A0A9N9Q240_9HELO|nr:hypothetical protein HYFRA_00013639 [Hymenoscyphus fraxineus]CAG8976706.1 hypothetical protein HYALB_00008460 [Hymenoscyphus albidus]
MLSLLRPKYSMLNLILLNLFNQCDSPSPWGIYFQDSATPQMEGLVELHDNIMFYLVIVLFANTQNIKLSEDRIQFYMKV